MTRPRRAAVAIRRKEERFVIVCQYNPGSVNVNGVALPGG
jgi:hypothetical protein